MIHDIGCCGGHGMQDEVHCRELETLRSSEEEKHQLLNARLADVQAELAAAHHLHASMVGFMYSPDWSSAMKTAQRKLVMCPRLFSGLQVENLSRMQQEHVAKDLTLLRSQQDVASVAETMKVEKDREHVSMVQEIKNLVCGPVPFKVA